MAQSNVSRISHLESEIWRVVFLTIGLLLILFCCSSQVVGSESAGLWRTDFKAAQQEAEQKRLPLLIHFYADWCMPCQRMERDVFSKPAIRQALNGRFVAYKANSDKHQDLVRQYGVETLPSDVVVDSLTGRVISLNAGFMDQNEYLAKAYHAEAQFIKSHPRTPVTKPIESDTTIVDNDPKITPTARIQLGDPQPLIGLDGFSPVALTKRRQWIRGTAKHSWDYKNVTYYFASREEMIEFRANPDAFAPRMLGCDPVILWESDKAVAGDIRFGAFFDDELYLFKSDERRRQFKANPEKYIRLQHALKADQIERTKVQ